MSSWALARAVILGVGLPFLAFSLGAACLDYAGEDLLRVCPSPDASTAASSSGGPVGSGSGSGIVVPSKPSDDCEPSAPVPGSGSGSATAP